MQFSQTPDFTVNNKTWWQKFKSQPHQLFFISAIFFSILIMSMTLFILSGNFNLEFSIVHSFGLNYAVFTNAFLGFLITVMPKYNGTPQIEENKYILPWVLFQIAILITLFINELVGKALLAFVMFYFSILFFKIIKNSNAFEKTDSIIINTVFTFGASLLLVEAFTSINLSYIVFYGYLLNTVFIVALRMVPMFYFNITGVKPWKKPKFLRESAAILFVLIGVASQFELNFLLKIVSFISLVLFSYIIVKLNFYKKTPAILSVATYSFFWLLLGFIVLFIESFLELESLKLSMHIFAVGYITTLLIGLGSRVSLGHAVPAQPIKADKITVYLFLFTQMVVLLRIGASLGFIANISFFMNLLYISSIAWVLLFILWSLRYAKILLRVEKIKLK
ncbi:MAG: NnrS family protein [Campylobacterota bacterium]